MLMDAEVYLGVRRRTQPCLDEAKGNRLVGIHSVLSELKEKSDPV